MEADAGEYIKNYLYLKRFPRISLHCKLVPVQIWEYEYGLFWKRCLKVHNKASNKASRAELSKYPMIIDINKKVLNYLSYLQDKDDNSMVK